MDSFSEPGLDAFIFDQLIVNITGAHISAQTWARYCEWSVGDRKPGELLGSFIWAPTYALSGEQRRALAAADRHQVMTQFLRVATLTDSVRIRGAIIALGWLKKGDSTQLRGFALAQPFVALDWLQQAVRFDRAAVEQRLYTSSVAFANLARAG